MGDGTAERGLSKPKAATLRAIELDDQLAAPHTALAYVRAGTGWSPRLRLPSGALSIYRLFLGQAAAGRLPVASDATRKRFANTAARSTGPSPTANSGLALAFFWKLASTIGQSSSAPKRELTRPLTYYYLAHSLQWKRRYEEAIAALREGRGCGGPPMM